MDFDKPMSSKEGHIVYNVLMDCLHDLILQYLTVRSFAEYPSPRILTDAFLTFMANVKEVELTKEDLESSRAVEIFITKFIEGKKEKNIALSSREFNLFTEAEQKEKLPNSSNKKDMDWLQSVRIKWEE